LRVFLDTNVLVSAFTTRGICADIVTVVVAEHQLVLGETVLAELARVLSKKMGVPATTIEETESFLRREGVVVSHASKPDVELRDTDDVLVLADALEGLAEVLVTGDRDFLDAAHNLPLDILSPRGFWERIQER
jgi:putative PIN family toxin of toxin-antitoxin system